MRTIRTSAVRTSAVLTVAFVGLLVGAAHAEDTIVVKVPFPFVVDSEEFAAGSYQAFDERGVLLIRGLGNRSGMFAMTVPADGDDPAGTMPAFVFSPYENEYRLTQVWESGGEGLALAERAAAARHAQSEAASDAPMIVLAANWQ